MNGREKIVLVSIGVPWFDTDSANRYLAATRRLLAEQYDVAGPVTMVSDEREFAAVLEEAGGAAALVLQIGTFPDGNWPARAATRLNVPFVVHSLPEPSLESNVPLNSLCGANMATFTLSALGHAHSFVHADPDSRGEATRLLGHVKAAVTLSGLRNQRLTLAGFRAPGFYPSAFDEILLRRLFGIEIDYLDLGEIQRLFDEGVSRKAPHNAFPTIEGGELSAQAVSWQERWYGALHRALAEGGHDLVAIRDWPELFDAGAPGGVWPAVGWLQDDGVDVAPEGDVNGAVTTRIASRLSGDTPFFTDISAWNDADSTLTLWHYGGAVSLARDPGEIRFGAEGREVEFTLKPGPAQLIRLGLQGDRMRMLSIAVEVLDQRVTLRRAGALARTLDTKAGEVVHRMLDSGWEHHVTLAYGDVAESVRAFAKQARLELTEL